MQEVHLGRDTVLGQRSESIARNDKYCRLRHRDGVKSHFYGGSAAKMYGGDLSCVGNLHRVGNKGFIHGNSTQRNSQYGENTKIIQRARHSSDSQKRGGHGTLRNVW